MRGGFHGNAFCDYPPTRNHATHSGSLILENLQGRTWPANPHCNYIKYHTHSTNSDQSPELHSREVIAGREEKGRGEKERERKFPTVGSWRAGSSFYLLSTSVSPFSAHVELGCLRVFLRHIYYVNFTPFHFDMCVLCSRNISQNVLQDYHRMLQSGCPDVFIVQVKQNTEKSFFDKCIVACLCMQE